MRLIDVDALKADYGMKDDCADCDKELRGKSKACEYDRVYTKMDFCGWLDDAPSVDAVPVVRCKNCIHWGKFPVSTVLPQYHKCGMATYKSTKGDDFCSDGKDSDHAEGHT